MGAYLSSPVKSKETESGESEFIRYGATTMQGWRMQQEDAHNCILDYDENCSFFAVYDGHGGQEVSKYASNKFPDFLKSSETWSKGRIGQALEESFLAFDEELTHPDVVEQLKLISGKNDDDAEEDEDKELLFEEATLPLEEVLSKYGIKLRFERESDPACPPDRKRRMLPPIRLSTRSNPRRPKNEANKREKQNQGPKRVKSPNSPAPQSPSEGAPKKELKHDPCEDISMSASPDDKENLTLSGCLKRDCNGKLKAKVDKNRHQKSSQMAPNLANEVKKVDENVNNEIETAVDSIDEQHPDVLPKLKRCKKCCCLLNNGSEPKTDSELEVGGQKCTCNVTLELNGHKIDVISNDDQCPQPQGNQYNSNANVSKDTTGKSELEQANVNHSVDLSKNDAMDIVCQPLPAEAEVVSASENANESANDANNLEVDINHKNSHENEIEMAEDGQTAVENNHANDAGQDKQALDGPNEPAENKNSDIQNEKPAFVAEGAEEEAEDEEEDEEYEMESANDESSDDGEDEASPEEEAADENESDNEEDETFDMPSEDTPGVSSGTTACVALIKGDTLYVANAGDSRCVLCRGGRAVDLSEDHKPEDTKEKERIEKAGGKITDDGRVNGGLNLSRAIGDHFYKTNVNLPLKDQMISSLPDIRVETLTPEDTFMVLACDGIWNSMSSQSVVDFVSARLAKGMEPSKICDEICDGCLADSTVGDGTGCDNMTVIIIDFRQHSTAVQKKDESGPTSIKPETTKETVAENEPQENLNL